MLADSALPVGSFAHSSGIEAAHQGGIVNTLQNKGDDVKRYIWAATQQALGMWMPVILHHCKHGMISNVREMLEFDQYVHSYLCGNEIACATSVEQGRNLLRVYLECFVDHATNPAFQDKLKVVEDNDCRTLLQNFATHGQYKHWCTVWSFILQNELKGSNLDEETFSRISTTFVGYNVARDIVAAAVRLNLVGAMAGQRILKDIGDELQQQQHEKQQHSTDKSLEQFETSFHPKSPFPPLVGCAPVIDILQSGHSILSTRLFRS